MFRANLRRILTGAGILYLLLLSGNPSLILADTTHVANPVGPGVVHHSYTISEVPWTLDVLEIDWPNRHVTLRAAIARDTINGSRVSPTSSIAADYDTTGYSVVGAVNADYFFIGESGLPTNLHIQRERAATMPVNRAVYGLNHTDAMTIRVFDFIGSVSSSAGRERGLDGFNKSRGQNELVLYNRYHGHSTRTNQWGTELAIAPVGDWRINSRTLCVITSRESEIGDMRIPVGGAVLSGHGSSADYLKNTFDTGDTIAVEMAFAPDFDRIVEAVGGGPKVLHNGVNISSVGIDGEQVPGHWNSRHPRTAIGFNSDTSKVFLVTVDGRQESSLGMTLPELVHFMKHELGAYHALNLDGGGSTTMVVRGAVENSPSDGHERAVGNAMLVVSSTELDSVSRLEISPDRREVYGGIEMQEGSTPPRRITADMQIQFRVRGWDRWHNPLPDSMMHLTFHADPAIGGITSNGLFTAAASHDSGYVWVESSTGVRDSAWIVVNTLERITLYICRPGEEVRLDVLGQDMGRNPVFYEDYTVLDWSGEEVGTIDVSQDRITFTAGDSGAGFITVAEGEISGSSAAYVDGVGKALLDDLHHPGRYDVSTVQMRENKTSVSLTDKRKLSPPMAFQIRYEYHYYPRVRSRINFADDIRFPGIPDSLYIHIAGDGMPHFVQFEFTDSEGEQFTTRTNSAGADSNQWEFLAASVYNAEAVNGGNGLVDPPISFTQLSLMFQQTEEYAGTTYRGKVYIDDFGAVYTSQPGLAAGEEVSELPNRYSLEQNYPNPFNPLTTIRYQIPQKEHVHLKVYDLRGKVVTTLDRGMKDPGRYSVHWNANQLSSGVYFYHLLSDNFSEWRKCLIIK